MNLTTHEVIQLEDIPVVIRKGGGPQAEAVGQDDNGGDAPGGRRCES